MSDYADRIATYLENNARITMEDPYEEFSLADTMTRDAMLDLTGQLNSYLDAYCDEAVGVDYAPQHGPDDYFIVSHGDRILERTGFNPGDASSIRRAVERIGQAASPYINHAARPDATADSEADSGLSP